MEEQISPVDTWVATLFQNTITQIILSLQNCDVDLSQLDTLQCEFEYGGLPIKLAIELGEREKPGPIIAEVPHV